MSPPGPRKRRDEIKVTIAPFRDFEDYKTCTEIQREVWRYDDIDVVPAAIFVVTGHNGGINLGAYNSLGEMIGFVASFLGLEGEEVIQHSHMLAVRAAYRNFDVGFKLKVAQRKETLRRKIRSMHWTFDPLQPVNAYFNFAKLGAWAAEYQENLYGDSSSALHRGLPTDRLVVCWDLDSRAVEKRLESGAPRHDLRKELRRYARVNTLVDVAPGITRSSPLKLSLAEPELLFEVPYNLPDIKARDLGMALEWQGKMRQMFRTYFRKGYAITDFWIADDEGHARAFYFLEKRSRRR
jgi:predicted GNAT superfamily acetyltransferase